MRVTRLDIAGLRRFSRVRLDPGPGLNLITGDNGAGKTSILEALHLMAYGRSFRGRVRDGLVAQGAQALEVFVQWQDSPMGDAGPAAPPEGRLHRAGLRHSGQAWEGRLDGQPVSQLGELCAALAVVTFEPGSHLLVSGGGEGRRRMLDWGLFHVEQEFLGLWRRYARALKQRNALLKARSREDDQLDVWEHELAISGEPLTSHRHRYLEALEPHVAALASDLLPAAGAVRLAFQPGWRQQELALADALLLSRDRDRASGFTSIGPHRADWRVEHAALPSRDHLSRGQAKLTALCMLLGQAGHLSQAQGQYPVVALDDLASELDRSHQRRVLESLLVTGAQVFITGTEPPASLESAKTVTRFHVEQGQVTQLPPD